jgi:acyl carrier protein
MPWHDGNFDSDPRVAQILAIVAKEAAVDRAKLNRDATIEELGIDSLDLTMTVFQLETVLDINIPAIPSRRVPSSPRLATWSST